MKNFIITILKLYIVLLLSTEWMIDQGILNYSYLLIVHIIPLLLFFILFIQKKGRVNLKPYSITILFPIIVVVSSLVNDVDFTSTILNVRWIILPLFTYFVLINLNLQEKDLIKIIRFIFWIGIIHIPLAFIKYFILQWHGETTLGLIQHSGSSYFVAIAFAFILSYANINSRKLTMFLLLGFLMVALASGKRSIGFILPYIFLLFLYVNRTNVKQLLTYLVSGLVIVPILFYILIRLTPTLNPDNTVGGRFDLDYAFSYVAEYEAADRTNYQGSTTGRVGTTLFLLDKISQEPKTILLGFGGDKLSKSDRTGEQNSLVSGVEYGITGLTWLSYQFGFIAAFIWFIFFLKSKDVAKNIMKKSQSSFWISYSKAIFIMALFMSFFQFIYSAEYKNITFISIVYMLMATAYIYNKQLTLETIKTIKERGVS